MNHRIACAGISGRILLGKVSKDKLSFVGTPADVTSDVIKAMMDKLVHHGGTMDITEDGKAVATITLSAPATPLPPSPKEGGL